MVKFPIAQRNMMKKAQEKNANTRNDLKEEICESADIMSAFSYIITPQDIGYPKLCSFCNTKGCNSQIVAIHLKTRNKALKALLFEKIVKFVCHCEDPLNSNELKIWKERLRKKRMYIGLHHFHDDQMIRNNLDEVIGTYSFMNKRLARKCYGNDLELYKVEEKSTSFYISFPLFLTWKQSRQVSLQSNPITKK